MSLMLKHKPKDFCTFPEQEVGTNIVLSFLKASTARNTACY